MALVPSLYRATLRACKRLQAAQAGRGGGDALRFKLPVTREAWELGSHALRPPEGEPGSDIDESRHTIRALFPLIADAPRGDSIGYDELCELVRVQFSTRGDWLLAHKDGHVTQDGRGRSLPPAEEDSRQTDEGFRALRVLSNQAELAACASRCESEGIAVDAVPTFLGSAPGGAARQWAYRCTVTNNRQASIQLLSRHWLILDESGKVLAEVPRGSKGVIGQQPVIPPGASFDYHSGTELPCAAGSMQGAFQCVTLDSSGLPVGGVEAAVARFLLRSHGPGA